jgi:hypothetical protein
MVTLTVDGVCSTLEDVGRLLTEGRRSILARTLADFSKILFAGAVAGDFFGKLPPVSKVVFVAAIGGCLLLACTVAPEKGA